MTFSNIYYKKYIQITLQTVLQYIICDLKKAHNVSHKIEN